MANLKEDPIYGLEWSDKTIKDVAKLEVVRTIKEIVIRGLINQKELVHIVEHLARLRVAR